MLRLASALSHKLRSLIPALVIPALAALLAACSGPAAAPPPTSIPPAPTQTQDVPVPTQTADLETDHCLACHTDKQAIMDTLAADEVAPVESEGEG